MKKIINKLNIFVFGAILILSVPVLVNADSYTGWDSGYSDYDFYGSSGYSDYNYGDSGYSDYSYADSGYSDYDFYGSSGYSDYNYGDSGYSDYSYADSGYSDYDFYGSSGYSDYSYLDSGYSDYNYYGDSGYSDYNYYGDSGYSDYNYYGDSGYSDYNYYGDSGYSDYDYYGNNSSNCSNCGGYSNNDCGQNCSGLSYGENDYVYNDDYYGYYQDSYYGYDYGYGNDYDYGCTSSNCNNNYNDLEVSCSVSDRTIEEGDSTTFTAQADGGYGSYTYRWSEDVSGSSRSVTKRFNDAGTYYATVKVTDQRGQTATARCGSVRVEDNNNNEDFDAVCKVSDTSIEEGDSVRFTAEVDGGNSPFDYEWSGDVDEDTKSFTTRFNRNGRYEVELKVTDDKGNVSRDTCSVVKVGNSDDRDINVSSGTLSSGTGNYASIDSVYLNQVPYTGPEDTAKGIAFGVGILAWSIAGALIIRNKMNKKLISSRVSAFKESNKLTKV